MTYQKSPEAFIETQFGTVHAVFSSASWVYVDVASAAGRAHVNDHNPALIFRGEDYIGSVGFDVKDGALVPRAETYSLSRRSNWSPAPRTYRDAMVEAIRVALVAHLAEHPETMQDGARVDVSNALDRLEEDRAKAARALADIDAKIAEHRAQLLELQQA